MARWLGLAAALWTCLGSCGYVGPGHDAIEVTLHSQKDTWRLVRGADEPVLLITCPSGIGSATIAPADGQAMPHFSVGLRYGPLRPFTRLEGFRVAASDSAEWSGLPGALHCGYFEVELPGAVFDHDTGELTIQWVDMYRTSALVD